MLSVNGILLQVDKENVGRIVSKIRMAVTTTVDEVDLMRSCRICLIKQDSANLFCLFGANKMFEDLSISSAILDCFGIQLKQNANLPNYVCVQCASTTLQSYTFKKCIKKCQTYLDQHNLALVRKKVIAETIHDKESNIGQQNEGLLTNFLAQNLNPGQEQLLESTDKLINYNDLASVKSEISDVSVNSNVSSSPSSQVLIDHNYSKDVTCVSSTQNFEESKNVEIGNKSDVKHVIYEADIVDSPTDQIQTEANTESKLTVGNPHRLENETNTYGIDKLQTKSINSAKNKMQLGNNDNEVDNKKIADEAVEEIENGNNKEYFVCLTESNLKVETKKNAVEVDRWWLKSSGPPYECKICGRAYGVRFRAFYLHVRMHRIKKLTCTYCGKAFARDKMKIHMRAHTNEKPFICTECPARFSIEGNLKRHLIRHTGVKQFICEVCGKAYTQFTTLESHMQAHEGKTLFVCMYCGKNFSSAGRYRSHLYTNHHKLKQTGSQDEKEHEDSVNTHTCSICDKVFSKAAALRIHEHVHWNNKGYKCNLCLKKFPMQFTYRVHTAWHELVKEDPLKFEDWTCEFCFAVFGVKDDLVAHILTHIERPFLCKLCGKTYVTRRGLWLHSRTHNDEKTYDCRVCGKQFKSGATLTQHFRLHTGEKPYQCDICLRHFVQKQQLTCHTLTHTGEKKYICPYCGKAFALNGNLTVHKRRHTGETPYVCNVCDKGFYDSSTLKRHKQAQHKTLSSGNSTN